MLTKADVVRGTTLTRLNQRALFQSLGYTDIPRPDQELAQGQSLVCWFDDLLRRMPFLQAEQCQLLSQAIREDLLSIGTLLEVGDEGLYQVCFVDQRYATWTHLTGFLDLETGDRLQQPTLRPLETVSYNLTEYFRRRMSAHAHHTRVTQAPASPAVDQP